LFRDGFLPHLVKLRELGACFVITEGYTVSRDQIEITREVGGSQYISLHPYS
jgi:hypothetical protein